LNLTLSTTNGSEGLSELQVVNMLGQAVIPKTVVLKGGHAHTINITGLSKGVYKVILKNREGLLTGTFIKK
jgi:hypothetical protein